MLKFFGIGMAPWVPSGYSYGPLGPIWIQLYLQLLNDTSETKDKTLYSLLVRVFVVAATVY